MSAFKPTPVPFRVKDTRLTVESEERTGPDQHWAVYWWCRCDCGTRKRLRKDHVQRRRIRSCGCLASEVHAKRMAGRAKHHLYGTRIWSVWCGMRQRCQNPKAQQWAYYGGRGIRVCQEWDASVETFRDYVLALFPSGTADIPDGLQIDRHPDNDGHYEPGNIRFVPAVKNNRNRRNTRLVTAFGETRPTGEWADLHGVPAPTIRRRLDKFGWTPEDAVSIPVGQSRPL